MRRVVSKCVLRAGRLRIDSSRRPMCSLCGKVLQNCIVVQACPDEFKLCCPGCQRSFGMLRADSSVPGLRVVGDSAASATADVVVDREG